MDEGCPTAAGKRFIESFVGRNRLESASVCGRPTSNRGPPAKHAGASVAGR